MRFEQIDKKVQEAAEKHHPAYDENAWQKMEKLLNQHLPVEKDDKRRVFLLLLIFLLIGGGGFLLLSKPGNKNPDIASQSKGNNEQLVNEKKPQSENASVPGARPVTPNGVEQNTSSAETVALQDKQSPSQDTKTLRHDLTRTQLGSTKQAAKNWTSNVPTKENNISAKNIDQNHQREPGKEISTIQNSTQSKKDEIVRHDVPQNIETKSDDAQTASTQTAKPPIHKEKSNWLSGFALLLSAGPDLSKAGGSDPGKLTLAYGAGISYTKNRFTLRTGVYAARKIYTAGPGDYKLSWQPSNIKFEGADADCYVIEIPVGLYYNFASKTKSHWFAGAGLSSYIMKSEKYDYQFKTSTGTPYYWPYEVKNENKHYFSVLNLSAGYNLHLSKAVSLSAEPYLKIPLSGIGVGKVQLNSTGVLFTIGIKPFK
jgi:hypothetical protein